MQQKSTLEGILSKPTKQSASSDKDGANTPAPRPIVELDEPTKKTVRRVFDSIVSSIDPSLLKNRDGVKFELHFINSSEWNACALTNGAVCIYSDLLPIVQTEGGLAVRCPN